MLGKNVHIRKKKKDAFLVGSKKYGLEVNADKTKYTVMSRDQYARRGQRHKD